MRKYLRSDLEQIDFHPGKLKRFLRKAYWLLRVYLPKRHDATVLTRNGLLTFDSKDKKTGRILHVYRNHEFDDMLAIVQHLRNKGVLAAECAGTVVDVGGYIGMSSTTFLLENIFTRSLAFEPSPVNFRLLQKNIVANELEASLLAFNTALSDQNGVLNFELSENNYGDHRVRTATASDKGHFGEERRQVIAVPARRFDDFLTEHPEIDPNEIRLIWMDIQGHEAKFLAGAREFLLAHPQVPVMMEFWPYAIQRSGVSRQRFLDLVTSLKRKFYGYHGNGVFTEFSGDAIGDYYDKNLDPDGGAAVLLANL
jgi:FkbM family methyltransferase